MEPSFLSIQEIRRLENLLTFSRFDAHLRCPPLKDTLIELSRHFESVEDRQEYKFLYKKMGEFFGFLLRDEMKAAEYFEKYNALCVEGGLEKAEALNLLGYAYAIDPTEKNPRIFSDALAQLPAGMDDISVDIQRAFSFQYLALMLHRQAMRNKSRECDTALSHIQSALSLQEKWRQRFPAIEIDIAHTYHLNAVILGNLGKTLNDITYLEKADQLFLKAIELENKFCAETGAPHFLTAITRQSHAMNSLNLNQDDSILNILEESLESQKQQSASPVDIAKSLHFIGEYHTAKKDYALAVDYYLQAKVCKMKIEYDENHMIVTEQNALLASLSYVRENIQLSFELRKKILMAMTARNQEFVNPCEDFVSLTKSEMAELKKAFMDQVSMKQIASPYALFGGLPVRPDSRNQQQLRRIFGK